MPGIVDHFAIPRFNCIHVVHLLCGDSYYSGNSIPNTESSKICLICKTSGLLSLAAVDGKSRLFLYVGQF